uniref:Uncharacterized protein n=2 Tax=Zooxanthella nutricula TaxID=1333877 RepID=A0A7S2VPI4_9DINO
MSAAAGAAAPGGATMTTIGGSRTGTMSPFGAAGMSATAGPLVRPAPPRPQMKNRGFLARNKQVGQVVGETGSQATMLIGNLTSAVKKLEDEIQQDERSLREMDNNLAKLRTERERLARIIAQEEDVIDAMNPEKGLGAAMKQFDSFMGDVTTTYSRCKTSHKDSIDILKKEFGYNPAFKRGRGSDEFTSAYHSMAPDPSKLSKA